MRRIRVAKQDDAQAELCPYCGKKIKLHNAKLDELHGPKASCIDLLNRAVEAEHRIRTAREELLETKKNRVSELKIEIDRLIEQTEKDRFELGQAADALKKTNTKVHQLERALDKAKRGLERVQKAKAEDLARYKKNLRKKGIPDDYERLEEELQEAWSIVDEQAYQIRQLEGMLDLALRRDTFDRDRSIQQGWTT